MEVPAVKFGACRLDKNAKAVKRIDELGHAVEAPAKAGNIRDQNTIERARLVLSLWFVKLLAETENGTVLGRESLNMILASTQREDFGRLEPVCPCSANIYIIIVANLRFLQARLSSSSIFMKIVERCIRTGTVIDATTSMILVDEMDSNPRPPHCEQWGK
jgi:hypothetical protein